MDTLFTAKVICAAFAPPGRGGGGGGWEGGGSHSLKDAKRKKMRESEGRGRRKLSVTPCYPYENKGSCLIFR